MRPREEEDTGINLRQLGYFRQVVDAGSITAAAGALHLAQPALGSQIRQLEEELGVELIVRHSRGVTPTRAGRLLYKHAQRILEDVEQAAAEVRGLAVPGRNQLRLGISPSMVRVLGPELLIDHGTKIPDLAISIVEERTTVLFEALLQGQVDIAFLNNVEEHPALERRAVLEEDLLFVTAPRLAQSAEPIGFAEALTHELAIGGERSIMRRIVEAEAARLSLDVTVGYEVHSLSSMKAVVARGTAATIMPYGVVEAEIRAGVLAARRIVRPSVTRTLYLVRPRQQPTVLADPGVLDHVEGLIAAYIERATPWARRLVDRL